MQDTLAEAPVEAEADEATAAYQALSQEEQAAIWEAYYYQQNWSQQYEASGPNGSLEGE